VARFWQNLGRTQDARDLLAWDFREVHVTVVTQALAIIRQLGREHSWLEKSAPERRC